MQNVYDLGQPMSLFAINVYMARFSTMILRKFSNQRLKPGA